MESLVLIGAFLAAAALCYLAISRFGRFLDRGGVSLFWDETEEKAAGQGKKQSSQAGGQEQEECCSIPDSKV